MKILIAIAMCLNGAPALASELELSARSLHHCQDVVADHGQGMLDQRSGTHEAICQGDKIVLRDPMSQHLAILLSAQIQNLTVLLQQPDRNHRAEIRFAARTARLLFRGSDLVPCEFQGARGRMPSFCAPSLDAARVMRLVSDEDEALLTQVQKSGAVVEWAYDRDNPFGHLRITESATLPVIEVRNANFPDTN